MLFFAFRTIEAPKTGNVAGLLAARLLLFYVGYFQLFLYASIFEVLLVGVSRLGAPRRMPLRSLAVYAMSWGLMGAFSAPFLLPMVHQANMSAFRKSAITWDEFKSGGVSPQAFFSGLFNPFSDLLGRGRPQDDLYRVVPYYSHVSYAAVACFVLGLVAFFRSRLSNIQKSGFFVLLTGGLVSFCWGSNIFALPLYFVPVLNRLRWPFKIQVFTSFFLVSAAAIGLAWLLSSIRGRKAANVVFAAAVAATTINYLALYLAKPPRLIREPAESLPLSEPLAAKLGNGKIVSLGYTAYGWSASSLGAGYATLFGLYHLAGYDPVIADANLDSALGMHFVPELYRPLNAEAVAHFRRWGVRWYVVAAYSTVYPPLLESQGIRPVYRESVRTVYYDPAAAPLFSWPDGESAGISPRIGINQIDLETSNLRPAALTMNFVYNRFFSAAIDGRSVAVARNAAGQMTTQVPAGAHRIVVRYRDPYFRYGLLIAAAGACLALCAWFFSGRRAAIGYDR
jgi:hypothetical protein